MTPRASYAAYLERCNEHRFDELAEFVHDDVVVNGVPVGLAGYAAGLRDVVHAFADYRWELRHLVADEQQIAVHLADTGTHTGTRWGIAPTGRRVWTDEFAHYRLADGRIAEVWVTADDLRVIEQLSSPSAPQVPAPHPGP